MAGGITGGMAGIRDTGRQSRDPIGSVNYGAVAGIQNYLQNLAPDQQGQASAYLRSQGLMPTYNGTPLDQVQGPQRQWTSSGPALVNRDPSHTDAAGNRGAGVGAGTPAPAGWQGAPPGRERGPSGAYSPAAGYLPGMGGSPNLMDPSGGGGLPGGGTMGFPLEGSMQGAIQGVLDNPSPYSAEQTARLQSRATSGNNAALQIAQQRAREDAARRGLSPTEVSGTLSAVGSRFDRQGSEALLDFETQNALQTRQGLMGGLQAGMGLQGQQLQNEESIRRYLAALAAAEQGSTGPAFLSGVM